MLHHNVRKKYKFVEVYNKEIGSYAKKILSQTVWWRKKRDGLMVDEKEDIKEYTVPGMKWEEGPAQEHGKEYKKISNEYVKIEKEDMKLENIVKKRFINLSTAKIRKEGW